jgi:organic radical activating enzyme
MNNEINRAESYSSANVLPVKLLKQKNTCVDIDGFITPAHIQVCPTNKCNLDCAFCSCGKRDQQDELSMDSLTSFFDSAKVLGTRAVTITGGGEPCCYSDLDSLISLLYNLDIKTGMVSNGLLLHKFLEVLPLLTWCRVSASDDRDIGKLLTALSKLIPTIDIDWAISYVVTRKFDFEKFKNIVAFVNRYKLTHVRAVSDILDADNVARMQWIKDQLFDAGIDDSRVVYQDRQETSAGEKTCLVSLLKPLLAADGYLYPCCGAQYAIPGDTGYFSPMMRVCHMTKLSDFIASQNPFNGSICAKCHYKQYNYLLSKMIDDCDHKEFV